MNHHRLAVSQMGTREEETFPEANSQDQNAPAQEAGDGLRTGQAVGGPSERVSQALVGKMPGPAAGLFRIFEIILTPEGSQGAWGEDGGVNPQAPGHWR